MTDEKNGVVSESRLQFFGKITASLSHEINNVFSIINENTGLLEDLMAMSKKGRKLEAERVQHINDTIRKHMERGATLIKRLNAFSHSVDKEVCEFDLRDPIENIVALSTRFAYKKRAELDLDLPREPVKITGNPFLVQQSVCDSILFLLKDARPGDRIAIELSKKNDGASIKVRRPRPFELNGHNGDVELLTGIAALIGSSVDIRENEGTIEINMNEKQTGR